MKQITQVEKRLPAPLSEEDILRGMGELQGYIDLTPQDFRKLYGIVHSLARERLLRERTAADIMAGPVFAVREDDSLGGCIRLLAEKRISGAPVVDREGRVIGVMSEKDILRLLGKGTDTHVMSLVADSICRPLQPPPELLQMPVSRVMSAPAVTVRPETSLGELVRLFGEQRINRVPVVDENGLAVGIITRANMLRAIAEWA